MGKIYDEIVKKAEELSKIENFEKSVNYRPFEIEITKIASSYKMDNELKEQWDNVAEDYQRVFTLGQNDYNRSLLQFLEKECGLRPGIRVIDVGCGVGKYGVYFAGMCRCKGSCRCILRTGCTACKELLRQGRLC